VGDLAAKTREDLLAIDHIGPASVEEIRQKLADRGLTLSDSPASGNGVHAAAPDEARAAPAGHPATVPSRISAAASPGAATAAAGPDGAARSASGPATASHGVARDNAGPSDDDAIDLLSVAGLPVLKRAAPVAAALAAVAVIALRLRIRRRRSRP
jgi:hypothetical protein